MFRRDFGEKPITIGIIGSAALDIFIAEQTQERFSRYLSFGLSRAIEEILELNRDVQGGEKRGAVSRRLGGPVLTIGQYLAAKDATSEQSIFNVSVATILGNDSFSNSYKEALDRLGINRDSVLYGDEMISICAYVYLQGNPNNQKVFWNDNVSNPFSKLKISDDFLQEQKILLLPITEPVTAKACAERYRSLNPKGYLIYNPGPYLIDYGSSLKEIYFEDIMPLTNMLVINRTEKDVIRKQKNRMIPSLFTDFPSLDVLVSTKDAQGSVIHVRDNPDRTTSHHSSFKPHKMDYRIETPTGAGDAFIGTFIRYFLGKGYDLRDAHLRAVQQAEKALTTKGGADPYLTETGVFPFDAGTGRFRLS